MSPPPITTHHVLSQDGTSIGYLSQGPADATPIILISGAMQLSSTYSHLSSHLSSSSSSSPQYIVHSPDRRGRGLSPKPYSSSSHDIALELQDIAAIMKATSCTRLFGLSSGAIIALEVARTLPPGSITHLAVYEPPFYPKEGEGQYDLKGIERLKEEIERGDLSNGLITALLTPQTAPSFIKILPRPLSNFLAKIVITVDNWWNSSAAATGSTFSSLLPGILFDFHNVSQISQRPSPISSFSSLSHSPKVLLITGSDSQKFLRDGVKDLGKVIEGAAVVELDGLDHGGPWDSGKPEMVAEVLMEFFR